MSAEPFPIEGRLGLFQARELMHCFGHHRSQTLDYALHYCLQCRKLKSCVRKSWGAERAQRWQKDDWWPLDLAASAPRRRQQSRPRVERKPVNIS